MSILSRRPAERMRRRHRARRHRANGVAPALLRRAAFSATIRGGVLPRERDLGASQGPRLSHSRERRLRHGLACWVKARQPQGKRPRPAKPRRSRRRCRRVVPVERVTQHRALDDVKEKPERAALDARSPLEGKGRQPAAEVQKHKSQPRRRPGVQVSARTRTGDQLAAETWSPPFRAWEGSQPALTRVAV